MSTCESCGAEIIWALTKDRRRMALDAKPSLDGKVFAAECEGGLMAFFPPEGVDMPDCTRHHSHHATCTATNPPPADESNQCPVCGGNYISRCRCSLADMVCAAGHHWYHCPACRKRFVGESDHAKGWEAHLCEKCKTRLGKTGD